MSSSQKVIKYNNPFISSGKKFTSGKNLKQ
jgi:hypothetical protein